MSTLSLYLAGSKLSAPALRSISSHGIDLPVRNVSFANASGTTIRGWYLAGQGGRGGIVLMHGVRGSRLDMLGRAKFLHEAGYSVLLFDFQAHGESAGERITFGYLEAHDARAAIRFMREEMRIKHVGVIGFSLGGVACVLGESPLEADALVLEAVYPAIEEAVSNRLRLRLGSIGARLTPLLLMQLEPRFGIAPEQLRPIARIHALVAPLLLIAGASDEHTTLAESQRLYAHAPEPKFFWAIPNAAHGDFHAFAQEEYEARVLSFFGQYLQ
jgi:fermentation-respiration switch protein FrsA (DUF1100 family)